MSGYDTRGTTRTPRRILALDIGTKAAGSGVAYIETTADERRVVSASNTSCGTLAIMPNPEILEFIHDLDPTSTEVVIEGLSGRGANSRAGNSTLRSAVWIGRVLEAAWRDIITPPVVILRRTVVAFLGCTPRENGPRADSMVAAEMRVRFGGMGATDKDVKGTKTKPGPLYGISGDAWQALGLAVAYIEGAEHDESWKS